MVEAAEGRARRGDVEGSALAAFDDLGNEHRLGVRILFTGFLHVFQKSLKVREVSRTNVHGGGAQEARFTNELGVGIGVGRSFAAEVPTAAAEFTAGPYQAVTEVLLHFLSGFLAEGFVGGEHGGCFGCADIGVVLASAGE